MTGWNVQEWGEREHSLVERVEELQCGKEGPCGSSISAEGEKLDQRMMDENGQEGSPQAKFWFHL